MALSSSASLSACTSDLLQAERKAQARSTRSSRAVCSTSRSACSKSLVHADSEAELLSAICGHLVELGGYRVAWVGYARDDEARSVEVAAHAGTDADYINGLQLSWGSDVHKQGGFGTAIHQNRTLTTTQLASDLVFTCWRELTPPHGLASALAMPLSAEDGATPFGVLGIYSERARAFEDEELQLLHDLADDLAFGIASRRQAGQRLSLIHI